jgi:hypothetical protein
VETIYVDGFLFSSGVRFRDGSGALLIHNEAFKWRPVERSSRVEQEAVRKGVLELGPEVWGLLDIVHPKPGKGHLLLDLPPNPSSMQGPNLIISADSNCVVSQNF